MAKGLYTSSSQRIEKHLYLETLIHNKTKKVYYRCRYQVPSEEKYKLLVDKRTERFENKDDAIKRAKALKHAAENNAEVSVYVDNPIVEEFLDMRRDYIRSQSLDDVSASYKKSQYEDIYNLKNYTPKDILRLKVSEMKPQHVAAWCNAIYKTKSKKYNRPFSYSYYKRILFQVRGCIHYARTLQLISYDNSIILEYTLDQFVKDNKKTKNTRSKDMKERYLTEEVFLNEFLANDPPIFFTYKVNDSVIDIGFKYRMLFLLMFYAGLRTCEARALRWSDIRLDDVGNSVIDLTRSVNLRCFKDDKDEYLRKYAVPKTNSSARVVALESFLAIELMSYKDYFCDVYGDDIDDMLLFPGETLKGKKSNTNYLSDNAIDKQIKKRLDRMNVGRPEAFTKHDFRRSCARNMILEHNLSYDEVYANFGHSTSKLLKEQYDTLKAEEKSKLVAAAFKDKRYLREDNKTNELILGLLKLDEMLSNEPE